MAITLGLRLALNHRPKIVWPQESRPHNPPNTGMLYLVFLPSDRQQLVQRRLRMVPRKRKIRAIRFMVAVTEADCCPFADDVAQIPLPVRAKNFRVRAGDILLLGALAACIRKGCGLQRRPYHCALALALLVLSDEHPLRGRNAVY